MSSASRTSSSTQRFQRRLAGALVAWAVLSMSANAEQAADTRTSIYLAMSDERSTLRYRDWSQEWLAERSETFVSVPLAERPDIVVSISNHRRPSPEVMRDHGDLRQLGDGERYIISGGFANVLKDAAAHLVTHCRIKFSRLLVLQEIAADFLRRKGWSNDEMLGRFSRTGSHVELRDNKGIGLERPAGEFDEWKQVVSASPQSVALREAVHKRRFLDAVSACAAVHELVRSVERQSLEPYRTQSAGGGPVLGLQNIDFSYFSPRGPVAEKRLREEELDALLEEGMQNGHLSPISRE